MENVAEKYNGEILMRAFSDSIERSLLWNFSGRPRLKQHNWLMRLFRKLFRMETDYVYEISELPSKGGTITFRRRKLFKIEL